MLRVDPREERHGYALQLYETRSRSFQRQLRDLFAGVAPTDSVTLAEQGVLLRPEAAREFDVVPTLPE